MAKKVSVKANSTSKKTNSKKTTKKKKKTTGGSSSGKSTSSIVKWNEVMFYANSSEVRGFDELSISGSVETEDKESGGTKFVKKKNSRGFEINLTAFFDKRLGIDDVKSEAMQLIQYAAKGETGYFYAKNKKLVKSSMMLTNAKAQKIIMTPKGKWISCEVAMTLKTCSKLDGKGGDTSSSGPKTTTQKKKKKQTETDKKITESKQQQEEAKKKSPQVGITEREKQVQEKKKKKGK